MDAVILANFPTFSTFHTTKFIAKTFPFYSKICSSFFVAFCQTFFKLKSFLKKCSAQIQLIYHFNGNENGNGKMSPKIKIAQFK